MTAPIDKNAPALAVSGLAKSYRGHWGRKAQVLFDVSFEVPQGSVFGLLGPNGAGKSTTIKILLGMMRPTRGTGSIFGLPLGSLAARKRTGFLPETPYFYDYLTPLEFLATCADLSGMPRRGQGRRIGELLERVGIDPSDKRRLRKYSKGMLQRVGLAQALLHDPDLLLLDEPMSGLDPVGRREVRDLITGLRDEGKTVVFSSHVLPDAETLCDHVGILVRGRIQKVGKVEDLARPDHAGFEIEAVNVPQGLLDGLTSDYSATRRGDRVIVNAVNQAELTWRLRQLLDAKASILGVRRGLATLEDVFLAELHAANAAAGTPIEDTEPKAGDAPVREVA